LPKEKGKLFLRHFGVTPSVGPSWMANIKSDFPKNSVIYENIKSADHQPKIFVGEEVAPVTLSFLHPYPTYHTFSQYLPASLTPCIPISLPAFPSCLPCLPASPVSLPLCLHASPLPCLPLSLVSSPTPPLKNVDEKLNVRLKG
jgi:hypothetical protein